MLHTTPLALVVCATISLRRPTESPRAQVMIAWGSGGPRTVPASEACGPGPGLESCVGVLPQLERDSTASNVPYRNDSAGLTKESSILEWTNDHARQLLCVGVKWIDQNYGLLGYDDGRGGQDR